MTLSLLLLANALADIAPDDRYVATDRIAVGVAADGSLSNSTLELGLLWDPDGTIGPEPLGGDLLYVGRAFEAWGLSYRREGTDVGLVCGAPDLGSDLAFDWDPPQDSLAFSTLSGVAEGDDLLVETWISSTWEGDGLWIVLSLTALEDLDEVWLSRSVDPDLDTWLTGSYDTINESNAEDGWVVAEGAGSGRVLALVSPGGIGGSCSWCALPAEVVEGAGGSWTGDGQVGVAVELGTLVQGETRTVHLAYGLGTSVDAALDTAWTLALSEDRDGDGASAEDCDDRDPQRGPLATEQANGIDDDCDGQIDEEPPAPEDETPEQQTPPVDQPGRLEVEQGDATLPRGCSTVPAGGGLLLSMLLVLKRRRR